MVTVPGIAKVAIGDQQVADVKAISTSQVLVIGTAEGRTTLMIWKGNGQRVSYTVVVRKIDPNAVVTEIKRLLGDIAKASRCGSSAITSTSTATPTPRRTTTGCSRSSTSTRTCAAS